MQQNSEALNEENRRTFDDHLAEFAEEIRVDDEFKRSAYGAANRVFRLLREKSKCNFDRIKVAGGLGKDTSINGYADCDCVVFINGVEPPFSDNVIMEFKAVIEEYLEIEVGVTRYSLWFELDGVPFDLLPATNELLRTQFAPDETARPRRQVILTLQKMKTVPPKQLKCHRAALTEGAVDFIQSRSDFVRSFIRLCKCWNLSVPIDEKVYIAGRSTLIETIAVAVAEQEEAKAGSSQQGEPSLGTAFTSFLELMLDLENIKCVAFYYNYKPEDVPKSVLKQQPLLLDPCNPRNNLLFGFNYNKSKFLPFKKRALDSLSEMYELNANANLDDNDLHFFFRWIPRGPDETGTGRYVFNHHGYIF